MTRWQEKDDADLTPADLAEMRHVGTEAEPSGPPQALMYQSVPARTTFTIATEIKLVFAGA